MLRLLATAERIRSVPTDQYAGQREALAREWTQQMRETFRALRPTTPEQRAREQQETLDRFVRRYLLNPRAPVVIREKIGGRRSGG